MPITNLPEPADFHGPKSNEGRVVTSPTGQMAAEDENLVLTWLHNLAEAVGLDDGSTPGSLRAAIMGLGSGKDLVLFVVGNEAQGDTLANCTHLDPGDGSAIEEALDDAYGLRGVIVVRRGTYIRPPDADPLRIPFGIELRGESQDAVSIVAPEGADGSAWTWCTVEMAGGVLRGVELVGPPPAEGVTAGTRPFGLVEFVTIGGLVTQCRFSAYGTYSSIGAETYPCVFYFPDHFVFGDQRVDDIDIDLNQVTLVGGGEIPMGMLGFGAGLMNTPGTPIRQTQGGHHAPRFTNIRAIGPDEQVDDATAYLFGMASMTDFEIDNVRSLYFATGVMGLWLITEDVGLMKGPKITNCHFFGAGGLSSGFVTNGVFLYPQFLGMFDGSMTRVVVKDIECESAFGGSYDVGVFLGLSLATRGCVVEDISCVAHTDCNMLVHVNGPGIGFDSPRISRLSFNRDETVTALSLVSLAGQLGSASDFDCDSLNVTNSSYALKLANINVSTSFTDSGEDTSTSNVTELAP